MKNWAHLRDAKVVRLNATLFPVGEFEASLFREYQITPTLVEAATPEEIIPHVRDCDALFAISVSLPTPVIEALERCRVISRLGTGTDKIAVDVATRRGIPVTNVPYFCVEEQADHAMAMLLSLARKLPLASRAMAEGRYNDARLASRSNQRLTGRTLGLVGFGNSARLTAQRARGFDLRVIASRRNPNASIREADALGVTMTDFDTVLRESDYLSLHLPLSAETYHLIDAAALRRMKPGAFIINTSRGALIDEPALAAALREGHIAAAGIDTFESIDVFTTEEVPPVHPLLGMDNVILTPHVAAGSVQSGNDVSRGGVQNVVSILSGHWPDPQNIVNAGVVSRFPLAEYDPALLG